MSFIDNKLGALLLLAGLGDDVFFGMNSVMPDIVETFDGGFRVGSKNREKLFLSCRRDRLFRSRHHR